MVNQSESRLTTTPLNFLTVWPFGTRFVSGVSWPKTCAAPARTRTKASVASLRSLCLLFLMGVLLLLLLLLVKGPGGYERAGSRGGHCDIGAPRVCRCSRLVSQLVTVRND